MHTILWLRLKYGVALDLASRQRWMALKGIKPDGMSNNVAFSLIIIGLMVL